MGLAPSAEAVSVAPTSERGTVSATGVITGASVSRVSSAISGEGSVPAGDPTVEGRAFWAPSLDGVAASAACFRSSARRACLSRSRISSSNALLKSPDAFRNSAISFPKLRASSGSFSGPKTTRTTRKTTIMCGMLNIVRESRGAPCVHHRKGRQRCQTTLGKCHVILAFIKLRRGNP